MTVGDDARVSKVARTSRVKDATHVQISYRVCEGFKVGTCQNTCLSALEQNSNLHPFREAFLVLRVLFNIASERQQEIAEATNTVNPRTNV